MHFSHVGPVNHSGPIKMKGTVSYLSGSQFKSPQLRGERVCKEGGGWRGAGHLAHLWQWVIVRAEPPLAAGSNLSPRG